MAAKDNKKRGEVPEPTRWSNEIIGIIWITSGLLLLLSLVKYSPADLPKWGPLEAFASKTGSGENLIGPVGGILGFIQILLFGVAGYLMPVGFIWFGVVKLAFDARIWPRAVMGFCILLLAGAAWLDAADFFFKDWAENCNLNSPGGVIGDGVGGFVLTNVIGRAGTLILTSGAYLVALIMLTGQQPVRFAKACYRLARLKFHEWRESRSESGKVAAREAEMLAERDRQREQRRKERETAKSAVSAKAANEDPQAMLPLREIPTPEIIDASQRRAIDPELIGKNPFSRKPSPEHQGLQEGRFPNYEIPQFTLLDPLPEVDDSDADDDHKEETRQIIIDTLKAFGIDVTAGPITRGPTITRYEIYPSVGLRVSRISQLEADIARATCAERINILAPIPGKDTVGIEIANTKKVAVPLHELLYSTDFNSSKKKIPLALGKDVYGNTVIADLAAMPHCLVAGATGSGKSVCINSIIASMLFKFSPDELRFIMVDPKVVEMQMYNRLPHLVVPVVTDPKKTVAALKWVVNEMEKRYKIFAKVGVRNFDSYNSRPITEKEKPAPAPELEEVEEELLDDGPEPEAPFDPSELLDPEIPSSHQAPPWTMMEDEPDAEMDSLASALSDGDLGPEADEEDEEVDEEHLPRKFPYIVVLIDELADLMQTAPADVEMCIARIAQKARAAGIHLIIATQTPRADVVTGIIKANIPSRIAFQVSSALDSRVILDTKGADKLVGKGDMLYLPPGSAKLERAQGAFVTDAEIERLIDHCAAQAKPQFEKEIQASINGEGGDDDGDDVSQADEELIMKCIEVVRQEQKASTSLLQRRLRLGYTRAARMVDILEQRGIVGPGEGAKAREVFLK
ncbi:MAG: DNA translocase FtsK 4TM domain-containing protein [Luteolibacter sp.]|uniref:FtsK/SpoIIIE family DNA translocase n=1 Tax=Luteolibacter sp. TaxID=1962973 RepID=UPI00326450BA